MKQFGVTRQSGPMELEIWLTEEEQDDFVGEVKASVMKELLERVIDEEGLGMKAVLVGDKHKLIALFDTMVETLVSEQSLVKELAKRV